MAKIAIEHIIAKGHENIKATHPTTFEITKEDWVTLKGDCIIGVSANKSPKQFNELFKNIAKREDSALLAVLLADNVYDYVVGKGSKELTFNDNLRMVFRRSSYVSDNTVMINADKAAKDINRELISKLKNGEILHVFLIAISF